jgi:VIT1/CCC1 family predicted Fe2+/Mn2+ transporter
MQKWLTKNKFEVHLVAFLLMVLPPIPLYYAAQSGASGLIWALLALVICGNLLALLSR